MEDDARRHRLTQTNAYWLLASVVALNILNFIDRILPQAFVVDIVRDLNLSYAQFAFMTGPMFGLVYTLTGLVMGTLADRYHRPRLIAGGLFVWSAMTAAMGATTTLVQATAARAFVAVGEATLSPSALSMLAERFPAHRRGLVSSLYYIGVSVGAGAAYLIAASLGPRIGWRGCFVLLGAIGVIASLLVLKLPDRRVTSIDGAARGSSIGVAASDFGGLLRASGALRWTLVSAILLLFGFAASVLDIAWLTAERGFDKATAAGQFGGLFIIGSLAGVFIGGPAADWCDRRFSSRYPYLIAIAALAGTGGVVFRLVPPDSAAFYPAYLMTAAGQTLHYAALIPLVQALAPVRMRGTVIAAGLLCMALLGTALGTQAAGLLADLLKPTSASPLTDALLIVNAISLLAVPAAALAWRRYAVDRARYGSTD